MNVANEPLVERLRTVFVEAFAEAALLRDPDRGVIAANVELDVHTEADRDRAIEGRFLFTGAGATVPWDGTPEGAEAIVKEMALDVAASLSVDPHEDDDWRWAFERRS